VRTLSTARRLTRRRSNHAGTRAATTRSWRF